MKAICLLVSVVALTAIAACSQDGSQAATLHALDEKVPRLSNGASTEEVEDQLGAPRSRTELEGDEISLYYGLWQLLFDPGLTSRARYYKAGYWPPGKPVDELDRDVRRLKMGRSIAVVEQKLGKPNTWQISVPKVNENLWYGPGRWKLVFARGSLVRKVLYKGGSPSS